MAGRRVDAVGAVLRLETPEGIDIEVSPAGPVPRGLALSVDESITQIGCLIVLMVLAIGGNAGLGVYLVIYFVVEWFYPVLFEVLRGGQTPGKKMFGLRVVNADATPIGWNASLIRNLLRVVDLFPGFYIGGLVCMCLTRRFQRLGDLAANTLVVHAEQGAEGDSRLTPSALERLGTRRPPVGLTPQDQRAFLAYAERHAELSVERAIELADVLEPLTGARGDEGMREVIRIANGIAGHE